MENKDIEGNNNKSIDKLNLNEVKTITDTDPKFIVYVKALVKALNIQDGAVYYGDNDLVLYTNYVSNSLESMLNLESKNALIPGQKLFSILKMIKLKKVRYLF